MTIKLRDGFAENGIDSSGSRLLDTAQDSETVDYLIISDSDFIASTSSLHNLIKYHESTGRNVSLMDVSDIGTSSNDIKASIQNLYF